MDVGSIISKLDSELVVQEAMYGFIMALTLLMTAYTGIIVYDSRSLLIMAILGMDFVWAVIDMCVFYRSYVASDRRRSKRYVEIMSEPDRNRRIMMLKDEFGGTVFEMSDEEDRISMAEIFADSPYTRPVGLECRNRNYLFNSVTAFVVSFATVIPSVLCLAFISDYDHALWAGSAASIIALAVIGCLMSPSSSRIGRIATGAFVALLSLLFTLFAAYLGG